MPSPRNQLPAPTQALAGRIPPQNLEAEVSTLGALLLEPDSIIRVADSLAPEDFYRPEHAAIYESMLTLFQKRIPIDLITIAEELSRVKKLDQVGGQAMLSSLVNAVATATNVQHYAGIVREKALLRRLIQAASKIGDLGFQDNLETDLVVDQAERTLFAVTERFLKQNFVAVRSILTESFERLDALSKQTGSMRGLPTGFKHLDNILGGLQESDLIIVAARPSMGKTALVTNIAEHVAVREKKTVGFFSLEMSKEQLVDRLISSLGLIDSWKLRNGRLNDEDFANLNEAYGMLAEANLFIDDAAAMTVMEVRAKSRRLQMEHGLDLIIIDYLQLLHGGAGFSPDNRVQEVSEISRSLKALAKELHCPVVALSQLSRAVESRPDKRPLLSDLRESGCLSGDTLIIRADTGERVPIRKLVGEKDLLVWSMDQHYRLVTSQASKVFSNGFKQTYELKFRSGRRIKATANHKFRTVEGWLPLDELSPKVKLAMPRQYPNRLAENLLYPDSLLIFLAHMVGDGCYVPRQPLHYTSADYENILAVRDAARSMFHIEGRIVSQKNWYHLYLPSPYTVARGRVHPFRQWLFEQGLDFAHSYEKELPESIFSCSDRQLQLFLQHLWATDGCLTLHNGKVSTYYATTSFNLAEQVQHLLLRLGVQTHLSKVKQVKAGKTYRNSYHLVIQGRPNQLIFLQTIGCYGVRGSITNQCIQVLRTQLPNPNVDTVDAWVWKNLVEPSRLAVGLTTRAFQSALGMSYCGTSLFNASIGRSRLARVAEVVGSEKIKDLATSDIYWDEISSITPLKIEEVFDITVPGTHNFVANDIVVHNSIEQDADVVIFLYREDYYNKEEENHMMDILVRKHRNGPTGDAKVLARLEFSRFENLDTQHVSQ